VSLRRRLLAWTLPVALVATGGCLATSGDVEKIQLALKALQDSTRVRQARSDSLTRTLVREMGDQLARQFARDFGQVSDSIRQVAGAVQRLQGDVALSVHDLRTQLVTLQEAVGQSQRRLQDLRSTVEATAVPVAPPAGPKPADAGAPPATQLFDMARAQLRSGATGAARDGFQNFLAQYPADERAGDAQMLIADAFAQEGNRAAADSVYALVVTKYKGDAVVSRSLWKRAMMLKEAQQVDSARALFRQIVDRYPRSDVGPLADEMLRTLRKP
jgi:TolA-binding protein